MKLPAVVSNGDDGGGVSVWRVLSLTAATPSPLPSPSVSRPPAYSYFPPYDSLYLALRFVPSTLGTPACITRHYSPDTCSRYLCRMLASAHSLYLPLSTSLLCTYVQSAGTCMGTNGFTIHQVHSAARSIGKR